ncbi:response regulator [Halocella sp. SP3-1]|uniref:response regulator n=1 Tax=Halocella sp. SP3-1 TaxID=2382161 RepID=UPI000F75AE43|nr:response regulator [Halocella sp. SP3-1]AZO93272.1 response regulator [Halocella sp. SP3-1]
MAKYILIVDDSKTVRASVTYTLKKVGYEVVEAVNGQDGVDILKKLSADNRRPSMIITDVNMPLMDGISFIKEVKRDSSLKFVPIIVLTTESQKAMKLEGKKAGAAGWLVKPFKPEQLEQLARKFVR